MRKESAQNTLVSSVGWVAFIAGAFISFRVLSTHYNLHIFLSGILSITLTVIVSLIIVFLFNVIKAFVEQNSK